jgi:hypothetical protein|tara:strand:+ start:54 stop:191 length:138 start_codon:yes stop_codon:yes gene_type:complete
MVIIIVIAAIWTILSYYSAAFSGVVFFIGKTFIIFFVRIFGVASF